jgi:ADP-ribosylglycohydrolase
MGYGYALWEILSTKDIDKIINAAICGSEFGRSYINTEMDLACVPSCSHRIHHLVKILPNFSTSDELLDFLFYVYGTTISSCDVFVASFALFLWAKEDVFLGIKLATMLGGDTDTIACLTAVLCCTYAGKHNIPSDIVKAVETNNNIDFESLANRIIKFNTSKENTH